MFDKSFFLDFGWDVLGFLPSDASFPAESRDRGGDSDDGERCDDNPGGNTNGNITYLPRERFRPGPDGCRATGGIALFHGDESKDGGSKTAWQ